MPASPADAGVFSKSFIFHFEPQGEICFLPVREKADFSPDKARFEMTGGEILRRELLRRRREPMP